MNLARPKRRAAFMGLTPLIDMIFLLLLFSCSAPISSLTAKAVWRRHAARVAKPVPLRLC